MTTWVIVGYKAAGKSTLARKMADFISGAYIDTDNSLVEIYSNNYKEALTVPEIFERLGDVKFRELETKALEELLSLKEKGQLENTVIATGGGLPVLDENKRLLSLLGEVIFLDVPWPLIEGRLSCMVTPKTIGVKVSNSIDKKDSVKKLKEQYEKRYNHYVAVSSYRFISDIEVLKWLEMNL